jgi:HTH-type transcriptional regulator / antitoxin HigA
MWLGSHFRNPRAIAIDIRPVRTNKDHRMVLAEIEALWGAPEGTEEGDKLDVLIALVEVYEAKRWPIEV